MRLDLTNDEVAALSTYEREDRVLELIKDSFAIYEQAIQTHVTGPGLELVAQVVLYSGGNDSTTLAHLFKNTATHYAHINTGIGIEETREFVRETAARFGLPLIEEGPDEKDSYRTIVLDQGFPGPGHHYKMYQRLKERGLRKVRRAFVTKPRRQRILFIAGRRRDESQRRMNIPENEREGSTVWVSPLVHWTKLDLNTYRKMCGDVPRNRVSDLIHMSGECLCGSFAHKGELEEIRMFFPDTAAVIDALEAEVHATGKFPEERCHWGNGAASGEEPSKSGPLCSSCVVRREESLT